MPGEDFAAALEELEKAPPHEFRIYLDDYANEYVIVDEIDYQWAIQWRWAAKGSLRSPNIYAYRTFSDRSSGRKITRSVYLHVEIQERKGLKRPEGFDHTDHRDANTRNCRRDNLRYATLSINRRNRGGADPGDYEDEAAYYQQLIEAENAKRRQVEIRRRKREEARRKRVSKPRGRSVRRN